jgi:hypothetical protein
MPQIRFASLVLLIAPVCGFGAPADPPEVVENAPAYAPLTADQRWHRYGKESILGSTLYLAALGAAAGEQLGNDPPEWHEGLKGYGRRVVSSLGTYSVQTTINEGVAAALHYEPRYIRSSQKGFMPRLGHAMKWTFLTYDADRHIRFNIQAVASTYGAGMISTLWYPDRFTILGDGVRNGNQQFAYRIGANIVREFAPELQRIFHVKL